MSVSGSSPPGVEESDGRPLLAAADADPAPAEVFAAAAAEVLTEDDIDASCNCGCPEVEGGSFRPEASEGADGEVRPEGMEGIIVGDIG